MRLVALLAGAAIILVAVLFLAFGGFGRTGAGPEPKRADGQGATVYGKAKLAGEDAACRSNLATVRQAITLGQDPVEGAAPTDLASLRLPASVTVCPIGGEPYRYDPQYGAVACPHPGHENY